MCLVFVCALLPSSHGEGLQWEVQLIAICSRGSGLISKRSCRQQADAEWRKASLLMNTPHCREREVFPGNLLVGFREGYTSPPTLVGVIPNLAAVEVEERFTDPGATIIMQVTRYIKAWGSMLCEYSSPSNRLQINAAEDNQASFAAAKVTAAARREDNKCRCPQWSSPVCLPYQRSRLIEGSLLLAFIHSSHHCVSNEECEPVPPRMTVGESHG